MRYSKAVEVVKQAKRLMQTLPVDEDFPMVMNAFQNSVISAVPDDNGSIEIPPKVVCLCGSTKFKDTYIKANREETLKGNIVLSVGLYGHHEGLDMNSQTKENLDKLHFHKISMSDEILVMNVDRYIGDSTIKEIAFAQSKGVHVRYIEPFTQK